MVIVVRFDTDTLDRGISDGSPFVECAIHIFNWQGFY
jgi:hypothetical protein